MLILRFPDYNVEIRRISTEYMSADPKIYFGFCPIVDSVEEQNKLGRYILAFFHKYHKASFIPEFTVIQGRILVFVGSKNKRLLLIAIQAYKHNHIL